MLSIQSSIPSYKQQAVARSKWMTLKNKQLSEN